VSAGLSRGAGQTTAMSATHSGAQSTFYFISWPSVIIGDKSEIAFFALFDYVFRYNTELFLYFFVIVTQWIGCHNYL